MTNLSTLDLDDKGPVTEPGSQTEGNVLCLQQALNVTKLYLQLFQRLHLFRCDWESGRAEPRCFRSDWRCNHLKEEQLPIIEVRWFRRDKSMIFCVKCLLEVNKHSSDHAQTKTTFIRRRWFSLGVKQSLVSEEYSALKPNCRQATSCPSKCSKWNHCRRNKHQQLNFHNHRNVLWGIFHAQFLLCSGKLLQS